MQLTEQDYRAALAGYAVKIRQIEQKCQEIRDILSGHQPTRKRNLSSDARQRIAEAQKKRWAKWHRQQRRANG